MRILCIIIYTPYTSARRWWRCCVCMTRSRGWTEACICITLLYYFISAYRKIRKVIPRASKTFRFDIKSTFIVGVKIVNKNIIWFTHEHREKNAKMFTYTSHSRHLYRHITWKKILTFPGVNYKSAQSSLKNILAAPVWIYLNLTNIL